MHDFDLVIRNGTVYDGSGDEGHKADVAILGDKIAAIGDVAGSAKQEIDAAGKIVTPGFVDIHSHYDGQATWDSRLTPSSEHGVTTVIMSNCGVGFAPCRPADRDTLISLMEGVEDIPNPVMTEGLPWNWESFADYLDALETRPHDIDFACQLPHGPLRVYVMGQRGADREPATEKDIAEMADITAEAMRAGALGFSTSRTLNHRTSEGDPTPSYKAAAREIVGIAKGMRQGGGGVFQVASDFDDPVAELSMLHEMMAASESRLIFSLLQTASAPKSWQKLLDWADSEIAVGHDVRPMVCGRPVGVLLGLTASLNPFSRNSVFQEISDLSLPEQVAKLQDATYRNRLLNAEDSNADTVFNALVANFGNMFILGDVPDYEQPQSETIAARADRAGVTASEFALDAMLENEGRALLYTPFLNYADFDLEASLQMMRHPNTVLGLADGGAHVGMICDASFPTTMLTHWTRDRSRGEKLDLGWVINAQSRSTALAYGLADRGLLKPGYKADLNVIDYDRLQLHHPRITSDLPAGGKRLQQGATGYVATIVSGVVIQRDGQSTGDLPGRLVRGRQTAPMQIAAE